MKYILSFLMSLFLVCGCANGNVETKPIETPKIESTVESTTEAIAETPAETAEEVLLDDDLLKIEFIDVGQGDSALISLNGKYMLVDAGEKENSNDVLNVLRKNNVDVLEYAVASHPHSDHMGGMADVINEYHVNNMIMPNATNTSKVFEDMLDAIEANADTVIIPDKEDAYELENAKIEIISPNSDVEYENLNNYSVVFLLTYEDVSILFTGDAEDDVEKEILNSGLNIKANVLKVGHHGSTTSTSKSFLDKVDPEYSVISVGAGNKYDHPKDKILERLKEKNVEIYRTDELGTITMITDGKQIKWDFESGKEGEWVAAAKETKTEVETDAEEMNYVLNVNSKKFHLEDCESAEKISNKNREERTTTRDSLINDGYEPCKVCEP